MHIYIYIYIGKLLSPAQYDSYRTAERLPKFPLYIYKITNKFGIQTVEVLSELQV